MLKLVEAERDKWDAVSYTSTFSNLDNHPTTIDGPRRRRRAAASSASPSDDVVADGPEEVVRFRLGKSGLPLAGLPARRAKPEPAPVAAPAVVDGTGATTVPVVINVRAADETREQKVARKALVKQQRKAARERKKASRTEQSRITIQQNNARAHAGPQTAVGF